MRKLAVICVLGLTAWATLPAHALTTTSSTFTATINLFPTCQFTTQPGNLSTNYTSFQASTASTTTPFAVRCTNTLPYTIALSSSSGTLVGLNYTLALRDSGDSATVTGGTGAGLTAASYLVKLSVAAGQSGTCATAQTTATACVGTSSAQSITITY